MLLTTFGRNSDVTRVTLRRAPREDRLSRDELIVLADQYVINLREVCFTEANATGQRLASLARIQE
jgi:hypothetical protein